MRKDIIERKEEILVWIFENLPKSVICRNLKCKPDTFERYMRSMNIIYKGNPCSKGRCSPFKKTAFEMLNGNLYISSHKLKIKLLEEGIKERRCEICEGVEWLGTPIPLELDHIDGNHHNWLFDNLRIICPNCHATQPTNSGKNKLNKRINRDKNGVVVKW